MERLIEEARRILELNRREGFTVPTNKLYPFQWNWDSGFVSIGQSYNKLDYAIEELRSLFSGQWENGMVPHILFHSEKEDSYFPNFDVWKSQVNPGAPNSPKSSGITQPAVHGFVLENLLDKYENNSELNAFVKEIFPKVVNYHRFLYTYRDPYKEGLMFIFHPWESGRDNSPLWDESIDKIVLDKSRLMSYERKDLNHANSSERPTSDQYDRYVWLLQLGRNYQYDQQGIVDESPFLVQDNMMNAILIKSNQSLINIGKRMGFDVGELIEWQQQSMQSFDKKLWNEKLKMYTSYDLRNKHQIEHKEIGGLIPLFAEIPSAEKASLLNDYLISLHERGHYICPSFDVDSPLFDSKRYWRGPIWPQMNWMLYHGLKNYDLDNTANIVKSDLIELVAKLGYYEYFEPQKEKAKELSAGYGGKDFSWTASSILDLIKST